MDLNGECSLTMRRPSGAEIPPQDITVSEELGLVCPSVLTVLGEAQSESPFRQTFLSFQLPKQRAWGISWRRCSAT